MRFARPCLSCGGRTAPGATYCPACSSRPSSCRMCGARTTGGPYCPEHSAAQERLVAQPWRAGYQDPEYQRNRAARYALANGRCEACGVTLAPDWECDHEKPLVEGGTHAVHNLRCRCSRCHKKKTAADRRRRRKEDREP